MPLVPVFPGLYPTAVARLLRALALAGQARGADADQRGGLLSELDELTGWLAERAADAPDNFLHLLRLVEAERAWAAGDFRAAALAFDAARREAAQRQRPWHRALIAEHAARFYLAHGLEHADHDLLAQARQEYLTWGAIAKVAQLDWAYPARRPPSDAAATAGEQSGDLPQRRAAVTAGTVDLLGILSASQALSSETSVGRLHARVVEVLSAMTGATGVHLPLWDEDRQDWVLPAPGGGTVPASDTGQESAAPMSVVRYVQRTREPLVVDDAAGDDRFSRDPYFAGVDCYSLLAVPILSRGALRAVLLLENRLLGGAFTAGRLDAVNLIACQLAVSLDNAQLYAGYRRIAGEQAALRRVATLVAGAAPPQEVFAAVAEEVGRLLAADFAVLVRYDPSDTLEVVGTWTSTGAPAPTPVGGRVPLGGRNVTTLVWRTGRPARIDYDGAISGAIGQAATRVWGVRSSVGVPVSAEGRLWGAMVVAFTHPEHLPADTESRLAGFTELVATTIANAEAQAEVTASRARVVAAADQARRRIERDLHDGTQQRLVSLALKLRAAQAAAPPELGGQLDEAVTEATGALEELTEIARGIHPAILAERGLGAALKALARRSPILVDLQVRAGERLPEEVEVSAYYVVAEALTNAAKHSGASAISVEVETAGQALRVAVRDDGSGGADLARGTGLAGLKDRVEALGGRILLDSQSGAGTRLQAEFPLTA
jgi:signal transduction histidine kinase